MPSFVQADPAEELGDKLQALQTAATTPARHRVVKTSTIIDSICDYAFDHGLTSASLYSVLDVITKRSELDQTSVTNLIKNLYPSEKVHNEAVTIVVGCLGQAQSKPPTATQTSLLKWLITVFEFLEDTSIISRLYGVLFSLLDMISLRSPLCHLLALATRRKHVKPFRLQQLLELANSVGSEPALLGLTAIYKDYYPDIIIGNAIVGRAKAFVHPNPEWRDRLRSIQHANLTGHDSAIPFENGFKIVKHGAKRSKVGEIPQVHTLYARESSVTLEEISNANDFVDNIDRIELPGQLIASLRDPLLQKYLSLRPSELSTQRIRSWLSNYEIGPDDCQADASYARRQEEVLMGILSFASMTQTLPPGTEGFMKRLMTTWDGKSFCKPILDCSVLLPLHDFEGFLQTVIKPLEMRLAAGHSSPFLHILRFHTDLARRLLLLITAMGSDASHAIRSHVKCFEQLVHHVLETLLLTLTTIPISESLTSAVIEFLEILVTPLRPANVVSSPAYHHITAILPQAHVIYRLLFDVSVSDLSRLCSILAIYKDALERRRLSSGPSLQQTIGQFNGYLMDVCNLLWRSRAFRRDDSHAVGCLLPQSISPFLHEYLEQTDREYSLSFIFGLSHHPALCSLSITAIRELEDLAEAQGEDVRVRHAGPVTQRSLMNLNKDGGIQIGWKDYRVQVLEQLEKRSFGGIKELMFSTMKDLFSKAV